MGTTRRLALILTAAALSACGTDGPNAKAYTGFDTSGGVDSQSSGGSGDTGATGGSEATGGSTETGGTDATGGSDQALEGPTVSFLAPVATSDPQSDDVVTTRTLTVQCQVEPSGDSTIDASKVYIYHVDNDNPDKLTEGAVDRQSGNVFAAEFNLAELPNGVLKFLCEARDTASPANITEATVEALLDLGPEIGFESPGDSAILDLKRPVAVSFYVRPSPLVDGDSGADVAPDQISLTVPGALAPIEFTSAAEAGKFTASIDFDDRALFDAAPSTAELTLKATNMRAAGAVTRTSRINIALDGAGPSVEIVSPKPLTTVRGEIVFRLKLSDPSGIAADKIVGVIPDAINGNHELTDWVLSSGEYLHRFDTNVLDADTAQASFNVTVEDSVGNKRTAALTLRLDNRPPLVSLDPPYIVEYDVNTNPPGNKCSWPFDPVGWAAANDGDIVLTGAPLLRVLSWDQTNGLPGVTRFYSRTDPTSVTVFARSASDNVPLLVNTAASAAGTTGDGMPCDEVLSAALGAPGTVVQQAMVALRPKGTAEYHPFDPYPPATPDAPPYQDANPGFCNVPPSNTTATPYCGEGDLYRITTEHPIQGAVAGIYGYDATNIAGDANECGDEWHLVTSLGTGWVCVAARAVDNVGNVGISRPLRLWIPGDGSPGSAPATPDTAPPSCTDNCTLPDQPSGVRYYEKQ